MMSSWQAEAQQDFPRDDRGTRRGEGLPCQQCGGVGGVATSGMMSHWTGNTKGGFYEEILLRSTGSATNKTIDPEMLHGTMLEMLLEVGVDIRLYTFAVAPVVEGDKVCGLITESKTGRQALLCKVLIDEHGVQKHFKQPEGYTIPYGCLVPKRVKGLLLAGRLISGTHKAHSNFRVMPICANIGQAAGTAAAMAAARGVEPRDLPVADIQTSLKKQGIEV